MTSTMADKCVMVNKTYVQRYGMVAIEVDHYLSLGEKTFMKKEQEARKMFTSKPRVQLTDKTIVFNRV